MFKNDEVILKLDNEINILEKEIMKCVYKDKKEELKCGLEKTRLRKEIYMIKRKLKLYRFDFETNRYNIKNAEKELNEKITRYCQLI